MSLLKDEFLQIGKKLKNKHIEKWQEQGRKVMGYYCTYIPEELLYAGGFLPFRVRATTQTDTAKADIYMVRYICSFIRATLSSALEGKLDFLDGLMVCNSCDHSRRMFEMFDMKIFNRPTFQNRSEKAESFYFTIPHILSDQGFEWFVDELNKLKDKLENTFKIKRISDDDLVNAINVYNRNRDLLKKIHQLRIKGNPKLNGSDALLISMANSSIPKDIANKELERILKSLKKSNEIPQNERKRILLVGSALDRPDLINIIEKSGGLVVSDFLCFGTKSFMDNIELKKEEPPLISLAKRLYYKLSCPRMMNDHERRLEQVVNEIERADIDGVILQRINNCDLHGCDNMLYLHELKDLGIPVFNIDREFYQADTSRLETRIQAFLEMIK
jgi:benzoyl-CoA reductase/2-hydroxyglutaryl-CoA dehydratase subunit BcrC/BadD/HgdB